MGCVEHREALLCPVAARAFALFHRHYVLQVPFLFFCFRLSSERLHAQPWNVCCLASTWPRFQVPFPKVLSAQRGEWYNLSMSPGATNDPKKEITYETELKLVQAAFTACWVEHRSV